jgi:sec-independent protein translocase protein TatA
MAGLSGWHLLILLAVFVLFFGAKRLPDMARAVGQSARIFKGEMKGAAAEKEHARSEHQAPATPPAIDESVRPVVPTRQPTSDMTNPPTG